MVKLVAEGDGSEVPRQHDAARKVSVDRGLGLAAGLTPLWVDGSSLRRVRWDRAAVCPGQIPGIARRSLAGVSDDTSGDRRSGTQIESSSIHAAADRTCAFLEILPRDSIDTVFRGFVARVVHEQRRLARTGNVGTEFGRRALRAGGPPIDVPVARERIIERTSDETATAETRGR